MSSFFKTVPDKALSGFTFRLRFAIVKTMKGQKTLSSKEKVFVVIAGILGLCGFAVAVIAISFFANM